MEEIKKIFLQEDLAKIKKGQVFNFVFYVNLKKIKKIKNYFNLFKG